MNNIDNFCSEADEQMGRCPAGYSEVYEFKTCCLDIGEGHRPEFSWDSTIDEFSGHSPTVVIYNVSSFYIVP